MGLVAGACAFALAATPALAHEFTASRSGHLKGVAEEGKETTIGPNTQAIKLGTFKVYCNKAIASKGVVAAGTTKTFATSVKFSWCWTPVQFGKRKSAMKVNMTAPLAIEYHANGYAETGSELEEVEGYAKLSGGEAEFKTNTGINEEFEKSTCHIKWIEQTIPIKAEKKPENEYSYVTFSDEVMTPKHPNLKKFPDGFQHYVKVSNSLKGIKYEFEGEPCEEWGKEESEEGGGGTYTGSFPQILGGGDFEYS
jgi:hypothetical protein